MIVEVAGKTLNHWREAAGLRAGRRFDAAGRAAPADLDPGACRRRSAPSRRARRRRRGCSRRRRRAFPDSKAYAQSSARLAAAARPVKPIPQRRRRRPRSPSRARGRRRRGCSRRRRRPPCSRRRAGCRRWTTSASPPGREMVSPLVGAAVAARLRGAVRRGVKPIPQRGGEPSSSTGPRHAAHGAVDDRPGARAEALGRDLTHVVSLWLRDVR